MREDIYMERGAAPAATQPRAASVCKNESAHSVMDSDELLADANEIVAGENDSSARGGEIERLGLAFRRALVSGSAASLLSGAALLVCSRLEGNSPARGINAISHWLWGKPAYAVRRWRLPFSVPGYAIHHASSIFWATLFERWSLRDRADAPPTQPIARAAAVTTLAYNVDFHLTPSRLTPGFQHVVSKPSLLVIYVAFAAGLALAHGNRRRTTSVPRR